VNADADIKMQFLFALRSKGVTDARVLTVMEQVDRAAFLKGLFKERAYEDMPLPIACGQTISQPSIVGLMTQALDVQARHKVLEIGTGSGYQAAILAKLARRVYTVDRFKRLVVAAQALFDAQNISNITAIAADGMTAAAEDPPSTLLAQLRIGGIMVLPVGQSDTVQSLIRVTKTEDGLDYEELRTVRFVPLLEGLGQD